MSDDESVISADGTDRCDNCGDGIEIAPVVVALTKYCSLDCSEGSGGAR